MGLLPSTPWPPWFSYVFVGVGGLVGSVIRHSLSVLFGLTSLNLTRFPVPTLIVNLIGAFLIGFFSENLSKDSKLYYTLCPGFCGGLTTFSTFCFEVQAMLRGGFAVEGVVYAALSVAAGVFLAFLSTRLHLSRRRATAATSTGLASDIDVGIFAAAADHEILH